MWNYNNYNRRLLLTSAFDEIKVKAMLDKFENRLEGRKLTTLFDGREVCSVEV